MTILRVPMSREDFQAVLEAAFNSAGGDEFVTKGLIRLALAYADSQDNEREWRAEDES